jgi:hypothetical protein
MIRGRGAPFTALAEWLDAVFSLSPRQ